MHTHTHTHAQTYTPFIPSVIWLSRMNGTRQALAGTRTHTQTQTHTHTHARARTRTHAHTTHTHTHTHIRTHTDIRTYMHTHIHIRARTRTYMHTRAHADTHTHTHTQTCTHTHTCTPRHARARERRRVNEDAWTKTNKAHICTYTHDIMMSVLVHDSWLNTYRKALWKGSSRHCAPSIVKCTTYLQQHTATLRNRLQHFTTDCNTSQQTATQDIARNCNTHMRLRPIKKPIKERHICSNTLQHFAIDCNIKSRLKSPFRDCCIPSETVALLQKKPIEPSNMPYHWALCSVWQCLALWCTVLQCVAVCCSVLQCDAQGYSVLQCGV